jgi:hypothetical protein
VQPPVKPGNFAATVTPPRMEATLRIAIVASAFAALASASGQPQLTSAPPAKSADEVIQRYLKTVGGMEKIDAVKSLRRTGKYIGGGGFEAIYIQENKRPNLVREDFSLQGMTAINAWDGKTGWKINPFGGKKDPESLSEDEMRTIVLDADFDDPFVNYKEKGNKAELVGMDQIEGTDVYKIRVTLKNGDTRTYYFDTDYYVPIKFDEKRTIRGADQEFETTLGDYKEVAGWYLPFAFESGRKGDQNKGKITYQKIEANVDIADTRFRKPVIGAPAEPVGDALDASKQQPKKETKPAPSTPIKPSSPPAAPAKRGTN